MKVTILFNVKQLGNGIRELRCIRSYLNFKTASTIATSRFCQFYTGEQNFYKIFTGYAHISYK